MKDNKDLNCINEKKETDSCCRKIHSEEKQKRKEQRRQKVHEYTHSVRFTIFLYFSIFIISILILMWVAFVFSLEKTYRDSKTNTIIETAQHILTQLDGENFTVEDLDSLAHENDMCIVIQDSYYRTVYSYDVMAKNCLIHGTQGFLNLPSLRSEALESENGIYYTEVQNPRFNNNTLLFVMVLGSKEDPSGYLYLNTSLEPLDSTVSILFSQMLQITVAVLIIGFGISYFLSRLIATPIVRITKSAQKMGQGDYNVNFNGRGYTETEHLAETLNYASTEISKVDTLQRDLIANVSHDLRTPLTMVKAYAEMIRDLSGDNPQKRNEHVGIIIEESDRLAALVNDILDLSKLENGTAELNMTDFCINTKLEEVMTRYKLLSEQKGYKFYLSGGAPVTVRADVIKIEQVLYNLINNAVNYSGDSREIYIVQLIREKKVRICITDTGPGIEKDLMPLIFDRYYRAEKHKREVIGTGLGLSIVKQILIKHGFDFGVQSELGVGSTFWFEMNIVSDTFSDDEIQVVD